MRTQAPRRLSLSSMPGAGSLDRIGDRVMLTMLRGWSFPLNRYNINGGSVEPASIDSGELVGIQGGELVGIQGSELVRAQGG